MKTQHFTTLKNMILTDENYPEIFDFFFDNFGEDLNFHDVGIPTDNKLLRVILKSIGKEVFRKPVELIDYRINEISSFNFIHGTCFIDDKLAMIIFFTDIKTGLASLSMGGAQYNFIRLKATELIKEKDIVN